MKINWRWFGWMFAGYFAFEWISFITYLGSNSVHWVVLGAISLLALIIGWRRPAMIGYLVAAELFVGSLGHMLAVTVHGQVVSIRMVQFLILMLVAAKTWWQARSQYTRQNFMAAKWPMILFGWVIVATMWALLQHYPVSRVLNDMNAFIYILVLPAWLVVWQKKDWAQVILPLLAAAVTIIAVKSWLLVALFTHDHTWLPTVYRWIRNTGVGEITPIYGRLFRVFFQSQVFGMLALWPCLEAWRTNEQRRWWWLIPTSTALLAIMISLSKSFWVGVGFGAVVYIVLTARQWRSWFKLWPVIIAIAAAGFLFSWAVNWPNPFMLFGGPSAVSAVENRLQSSGSADAATARKNQIQPLLSEISRNPVVGRGFGATVRYFSTDPRVHGWRETSAFELGYLDWWLKMGIIGLGILAAWMWVLARGISRHIRVWALASVAALLAVHMFTPYLNHPLGLGWLALLTIYPYGD